MTKTVLKVLVATGLVAALALAQGRGLMNTSATPPDPQAMAQMRVNRLARLLNLTDAQKASALTTFTQAYTANQSTQSNLRSARQSLSDAVKKNQTGLIDSLALQIGTYEGQLIATDSKAEAAFYLILTPDQQAIYDKMPGGAMGGPGGPMGPGGRMGPAGRGR
jgi:Spy/CpxP family protein refolding chaperone